MYFYSFSNYKSEEENYTQILLTLNSIFSQTMDEFDKQVQTLEE